MGKISVELNILEENHKKNKRAADNIENIRKNFISIKNTLDYDIRVRQGIDQDMREITKELEEIILDLRRLSQFSIDAKRQYEKADKLIEQMLNKYSINENIRVSGTQDIKGEKGRSSTQTGSSLLSSPLTDNKEESLINKNTLKWSRILFNGDRISNYIDLTDAGITVRKMHSAGFNIIKRGKHYIVYGKRKYVLNESLGRRYNVSNATKYPALGKYVDPSVAVKEGLKNSFNIKSVQGAINYGFIALETGVNVHENIKNKEKTSKILGDATVDIGVGVATTAAISSAASVASAYATSIATGAAIGSIIPAPIIGTLVGAVAGIAVGALIDLVIDFRIGDKSIIEWTKYGVGEAYEWVGDVSKKVGEGAIQVVNTSVKATKELMDDIGDVISDIGDAVIPFGKVIFGLFG